jgi:hypothetical protein
VAENRVDGAPNLLGLGHIGRDRQAADLDRDRLRCTTVPVEHGNCHTLVRQPARDRPPDAAAATSDKPDPPVQPVHDRLLISPPKPAFTLS